MLASWLNQVEVYFSLVQRKMLTPNDYPDLDALRVRLAFYEELTNRSPKPFVWNFTRQKLRGSPRFLGTFKFSPGRSGPVRGAGSS